MEALTLQSVPAGARDLAEALTADLGDSREPRELVSLFIETDQLDAARAVLSEIDAGPEADLMSARISEATQAAVSRTQGHLERVRAACRHSSVPCPLDESELVDLAAKRPDLAREELRELEELVAAAAKERKLELLAEAALRVDGVHVDQKDSWLTEIGAAIDLGALGAVSRVLRGDASTFEHPWFTPSPVLAGLPKDPEAALDQILACRNDPDSQPAFRQRYGGEAVQSIARTFRRLDGTSERAQEFADTLMGHLRGEVVGVERDKNGVGYLMPFDALARSTPAARFPMSSRVVLWIADASVTELPDTAIGNYVVAIGAALRKPTRRSRVAVIDAFDLVRVMLADRRPQVVLLRSAAQHWEVSAVAHSSDRELDESLGATAGARDLSIEWMVDLAGLGRMLEAGSVIQASGRRPALIRRALQELDNRSQTVKIGESLIGALPDEEPVLAGMPRVSAADRAAFWAVLAAGEFGTVVLYEELDALIELATDVRSEQLQQRVRTGLERLAEHGIVEQRDSGVVLERWDYIEPLLPVAERRLRRHLERVAEATDRAEVQLARRLSTLVEEFSAHERRAYERHRDQNGNAGPTPSPQQQAVEPGLFEPRAELAALKDQIESTASDVKIEIVEHDEWPRLNLSRAGFALIFNELVMNAAAASEWACRVRIELHEVDDFGAEVRVSDSGPGIDQNHQTKIFRAGYSYPSRPTGGDGLAFIRTLLRELDGEINLLAAQSDHAVFSGATFGLSIPRLA